MKRFDTLPAWLAMTLDITGGDDDPADAAAQAAAAAAAATNANGENNFGSEAIGELLARLDTKDANNKKLADDLTAAQTLLREQENARLSAEQQATRNAAAEKRALEKRATDAEAAAAEGAKAIAYATALGIKRAIETLKTDDGKALKYTWADVDTVYELLDIENIEFDFDKDSATGLVEQLDELATKKSFLLAPATNGGYRGQMDPPPGPIGVAPGNVNSGNGNSGAKTALDYAGTYSAFAKIAGRPQQAGYAVQSTR